MEGYRLISDLSKLEKWAGRTFMKFSKKKCQILHLGRYSHRQQYRDLARWRAALQKMSQ